jgi:hypothetical protein
LPREGANFGEYEVNKTATPIHLALSFLLTLSLLPSKAHADDALSVAEFPEPPAQTHFNGDTKLTLTTVMRGSLIDEQFQNADTAGLGVAITLDQKLAETLTARISVGANLDTGATQTTYSNEYALYQGIFLLDAYLDWKPLSDKSTELDFKFGAVNQSWMDNELLVGDKSFPSLIEAFKTGGGVFSLKLSAEQAIPTSDTTNSIPQGNEPLPTADFERVTLGLDFPHEAVFQVHVGHYAFNNLPSGVALDSRYGGNSITGVGDQGSEFVYNFSGIESGAMAEFYFAHGWRLKLDGIYMTNLQVPLDQSSGIRTLASLSYSANPNLVITPTAQWFRNESDSAPAYYNTSVLAHNNRDGWGAGIKLALPVNHLEIEGSYIAANVIDTNPFQANLTGVVFSLRKTYELY